MRIKAGDLIKCRIKEGKIVRADKEFDDVKVFEIIAVVSDGLYLYVPEYYSLQNTTRITDYWCKKINIDRRFLEADMTWIDETMICRIVQHLDGMSCAICKDFFPMATANQADETLICWTCRQNPYH